MKKQCPYLLAWVLLLAAPFGQAAYLAHAVVTAADRHEAAERILSGPNAEAQIVNALQADREHAGKEASPSLPLSLMNLGLPVPPNILDLAAKADGFKQITPEEADNATHVLNNMLEKQHSLLDHKVIDCREKQRSIGEAIEDITEEVRNLASETSSARSIIVEATSRIPQDQHSFREFKTQAYIIHDRCQDSGQTDKIKAQSLERDASTVRGIQQALSKQCKTVASSFVQEPRKSSENSDCQDAAAALGVVARKRGVSAAFLQDGQPMDMCKLTRHNCTTMLKLVSEIVGDISASQAQLATTSARNQRMCKEEDRFAKRQQSMETSQASERSRELGEATLKAGEAGDLTHQKDSQRQKNQEELKAITAKCTAQISDIVYGKMCALQRLRDNLQIRAGRTELPEDCQVTEWDEGICSATCGGGLKTLTRKVMLTSKGGAACPSLSLNLRCGETACPRDCQVSRFSEWSACSAHCNGGVQERNRVVTSKLVGNGVGCPHLVDMRLCNSEACPSK